LSKIVDILEHIKSLLKERLDSHELYLEGGSLFILANAVGRLARIEYRDDEIPINIFLGFIGPTHRARKTSILRLIRKLCIYPNIPGDITQQELIHELNEDDGFGWQYIDELSEIFKDIKSGKSYFTKSYRTYLLLYTGDDYERATRGSGKIKVEKPCFSLLGATTPSSVVSIITETDIEGGFLPRFLLLWIEEKDVERQEFQIDTNYKRKLDPIFMELNKCKIYLSESKLIREYDEKLIENQKMISILKGTGADTKTIKMVAVSMDKKAEKIRRTVRLKKKILYLDYQSMKALKDFDDEIIKLYSDTPMMAFASNYEMYLIKVAALYAIGKNFDYFIRNDRIRIVDTEVEMARDFILRCLKKIEDNFKMNVIESKNFDAAFRRVMKVLSKGISLTDSEFHFSTNTDIYTSTLVLDTLLGRGTLEEETNKNNEVVYFIKGAKKTEKMTIRTKVIDAIKKGKRTPREIYRLKHLYKDATLKILEELVKEKKIENYDTTDYGIPMYKFPRERLKPTYKLKREKLAKEAIDKDYKKEMEKRASKPGTEEFEAKEYFKMQKNEEEYYGELADDHDKEKLENVEIENLKKERDKQRKESIKNNKSKTRS